MDRDELQCRCSGSHPFFHLSPNSDMAGGFGAFRNGFTHRPWPNTNLSNGRPCADWKHPSSRLPSLIREHYNGSIPQAACGGSNTCTNPYPVGKILSSEDVRMTVLEDSRRASSDHGFKKLTSERSKAQIRTCSCSMDEQMQGCRPTSSSSLQTVAQDSHSEAQQFPRIPVVGFLNSLPASLSQQSGHVPNIRSSSAFKASPPATKSSSKMSISSSSSSTIRLTVSVAERRHDILNKLYFICVDASASYLQTIRSTIRTRVNCDSIRSNRGAGRYHPYATSQHNPRGFSSPLKQPKSLMDNISTICTYLWRKARRDLMAPHQAEAEAVAQMRELYIWGEVMARSLEDDEEGEHEESFPAERVAKAARGLCEYFGEGEAWREVRDAIRELKDLATREEWESEGEII